MTEVMAWLALLTAWVSLLWVGGVIMEWVVPMVRRSIRAGGSDSKGK